MFRVSRWFSLLAVCVLLASATSAQAQSKQSRELKRRLNAAARLYEDLEYEKALEQLKRAKALNLDTDDSALVAIYQGLVLADLGKQQQAVEAFSEGLSLNPDAQLPIKVSPKVVRLFEEVREDTRRKLARIEAQDGSLRRKEEERQEAERKAAEAQRQEEERKAAEEARLIAERKAAEDAQAKLAAERQAAEEAHAKLVAERKATDEARLAEQREAEEARRRTEAAQQREAEEARRRAEAAAQQQQQQVARADVPPAQTDAPRQQVVITQLQSNPAQEALAAHPEVETARSRPVTPFVLAGVSVLAGGVGGYFGLTSKHQADDARSAVYQDDTLRYLDNSKSSAMAANVLLGAAGVALAASVITFFTMDGEPRPATATVAE